MNLQVKSFEDYQKTYQYSVDKPEEFWAEIADNFFWQKKWNKVLSWDFKTPTIKRNR